MRLPPMGCRVDASADARKAGVPHVSAPGFDVAGFWPLAWIAHDAQLRWAGLELFWFLVLQGQD